ncbi:VOC family protein [Yinghuangia soli]|uniref:VOC family protein n=1 Tax=Yinghuangia soli TaxID=2908204 RepID=A0AA41PW26_9ACTN|nr:VOC family protein [Yinghuangia soli]MCF2526766.1 VOC family protein [Yinghuangia soli]
MPQQIFVNLPVKDLDKSTAFYTALGYTVNPQFTDENAACVVISDTIFVMLITEAFFGNFTKKPIADATSVTEAINCLSVESREDADRIAELAFANGGAKTNDPMDQGPMYGRSFQDPDGHQWELMYMDPAAFES